MRAAARSPEAAASCAIRSFGRGFLGLAANALGYTVASPVFDGVPEKTIREELIKAGFPEDGKIRVCDGRSGEAYDNPKC